MEERREVIPGFQEVFNSIISGFSSSYHIWFWFWLLILMLADMIFEALRMAWVRGRSSAGSRGQPELLFISLPALPSPIFTWSRRLLVPDHPQVLSN